jgi:hypothetical protein
LLLPLASALIAVWMLLRRGKQSKKVIAAEWLVAGLLMAYFLDHVLFPPVARVRREYYQGKDQFAWVSQLGARDEKTRREAVLALCEMLKASRTSVRWWIV